MFSNSVCSKCFFNGTILLFFLGQHPYESKIRYGKCSNFFVLKQFSLKNQCNQNSFRYARIRGLLYPGGGFKGVPYLIFCRKMKSTSSTKTFVTQYFTHTQFGWMPPVDSRPGTKTPNSCVLERALIAMKCSKKNI